MRVCCALMFKPSRKRTKTAMCCNLTANPRETIYLFSMKKKKNVSFVFFTRVKSCYKHSKQKTKKNPTSHCIFVNQISQAVHIEFEKKNLSLGTL